MCRSSCSMFKTCRFNFTSLAHWQDLSRVLGYVKLVRHLMAAVFLLLHAGLRRNGHCRDAWWSRIPPYLSTIYQNWPKCHTGPPKFRGRCPRSIFLLIPNLYRGHPPRPLKSYMGSFQQTFMVRHERLICRYTNPMDMQHFLHWSQFDAFLIQVR